MKGLFVSSQPDEAAMSSTFQQKWCELQKLLERQRSKGGIIDPEVESNRFLIHINEVRQSELVRLHSENQTCWKLLEKLILSLFALDT